MEKYELLKKYKKNGVLDSVEVYLPYGYSLRPTKNTILFYNEELDIIMFTNVYVNNRGNFTSFFDKSYQIESKEILRIDI
ncbi:hypothetical protein [Clostridium perfringens]|jgi:hypothetical protein|uniref:Uncharacterized protein n=1 Tax=Clostridium perfringens TaxID=1502 RepID=A0AAW4IXU1_CLOPF|nr:hypothetical protein [Clostridium perfringens]MBO3356223.1 hypothetical protein [Clostridium perfringens]MBO3359436.1 hypothetical protein [Clostridium perfringens]